MAMSALLPEPLTEPEVTGRPRLSPTQDFRVRVARNDLEQAGQLDVGGTPPADLVLMVGALTSSLYNVLQLVADLAEVTE
ncbi:hypothetical protein [Streptacidiphilus sp. EB129]|uniref:hypothetical protein n=1 Tax=Streptacidiphilus sp. EB129 TaxID=3156262 RepID=UPI003515FA5E